MKLDDFSLKYKAEKYARRIINQGEELQLRCMLRFKKYRIQDAPPIIEIEALNDLPKKVEFGSYVTPIIKSLLNI